MCSTPRRKPVGLERRTQGWKVGGSQVRNVPGLSGLWPVDHCKHLDEKEYLKGRPQGLAFRVTRSRGCYTRLGASPFLSTTLLERHSCHCSNYSCFYFRCVSYYCIDTSQSMYSCYNGGHWSFSRFRLFQNMQRCTWLICILRPMSENFSRVHI